jgi:cAMP phosphodiesterase
MPSVQEVGHSSFLLNAQNIIDAGHILQTLGEKSVLIETVWVTHAHLDHIVDLAFIVDEYFDKRTKTLKIMALQETIDVLKAHIFNNAIWPDFSNIPLPNGEGMAISYEVLDLDKTYSLGEGKQIQAFLGDHTVASAGYLVKDENKSIFISSDTHSLAHVVKLVDENPSIHTLVLECSFPTCKITLAQASKHLTPALLFEGIKPLEGRGIKLYVNHIKPSYEDEIIAEIAVRKGQWDVTIVDEGEIIKF